MALINPAVDIALISAVVVVVSRFLQNKFIDKKKQKEMQQRMKEKQAKMKELMKNSDDKSKKEMERLQTEMLEEMNESMQGSMRYMLFSLPVFFGVFFVLGSLYGNGLVEAPFLLPKFQGFFLLNPFSWVPVGWSIETGWLKWYFISYLLISIGLGIVFKLRELLKKKEENIVK